MRRAALAAAALVALATGLLDPTRLAAESPLPRVDTATEQDGTRSELRLPGELVAGVVVPAAEGGARLLLLSAAADDPEGVRALYGWDPKRPTELALLLEGLSAGLDALDARDLDADGRVELLAGEPRQLYCLGSLGASTEPRWGLQPRPVGAPGWLDLRSPVAARLRLATPEDPWLATAEVGRARVYRVGGGELTPAGEARLPVSAAREPRGLLLTTPPLALLGRAGEAPMLFAGPENVGDFRLRTQRVALDHPESGEETWARLPGAERAESRGFVEIDGATYLWVGTVSAAKLAIFEEQTLRLFPIVSDRTRSGAAPRFSAPTASKRWQPIQLAAPDLDGDGHDDLLVAGAKGLSGDEIALDAYRGLGEGRFDARAWGEAELKASDETPLVGPDFDGDGRSDLVAWEHDAVSLFRGRAPDRKGAVELRAVRKVQLAPRAERESKETTEARLGSGGLSISRDARSRLVADLDGDGRPELVALGEDDLGRGVAVVVAFR